MPWAKGARNLNGKLTEREAREIASSPEKTIVLSLLYGISISQVSRIRTGRQWKHLRPVSDVASSNDRQRATLAGRQPANSPG